MVGEIERRAAGADDRQVLIEVAGLAKSFNGVTAVDGVSFDVFSGEIFGFLGPNGAGKTTTINLLTGLSKPDSGAIRIAGEDGVKQPKAVQELIGVVPDESNLYPELSGFANLCFCAALYGMRKRERRARARTLLQAFGLDQVAERKFGAYSRGMKRKLTIAAAMMHEPPILFLDEPTSGIDVASARQIRQLIADLHANGTTIFLTTHYIEEAERLCERIAFMVKGRLVRTDTLANLLKPLQDRHVLLLSFSTPQGDLCDKLSAAFPQLRCRIGSAGQIRVESGEPIHLGSLLKWIEAENAELFEARRLTPSLEDVFVQITGIGARALTEKDAIEGGAA